MNPVSILIHSGAPNDAKLFDEIMENMQKRRIIEKGDIIIFDKGYVRQEASLFSIQFSENRTFSQSLLCGISPIETANPVMDWEVA